MYSFSYLEPVCCSISSSNCCFLTCIQVSQEAGQVVWYAHLRIVRYLSLFYFDFYFFSCLIEEEMEAQGRCPAYVGHTGVVVLNGDSGQGCSRCRPSASHQHPPAALILS